MRRVINISPALSVEVVEHRREDDPSHLALLLAEAYDLEGKARADAAAFQAQAVDDERQARELQVLSSDGGVTLHPRTGRPRRMDPLREMNHRAVEDEVRMRGNRAQEFRERADRARAAESEAKREAARITENLRSLRTEPAAG